MLLDSRACAPNALLSSKTQKSWGLRNILKTSKKSFSLPLAGKKMDEQGKDCFREVLTDEGESRASWLLFEFWLVYQGEWSCYGEKSRIEGRESGLRVGVRAGSQRGSQTWAQFSRLGRNSSCGSVETFKHKISGAGCYTGYRDATFEPPPSSLSGICSSLRCLWCLDGQTFFPSPHLFLESPLA